MPEPEIRLLMHDIHKRYRETIALDGVSMEVGSGEIFGLIGPDGAGKTTIMRIACGLVVPDQGEARVMGFDCVHEPQKVKEHIGYMPQRFSLYPDLTVAENLRFFADLFGVPSDERRKREERLMEFSGLQPFRSRRSGALSGGMKQKLALCCTLIHTPEVLVLDEPTTGVDVVSRGEFWDILRDLAADGMTLLVSTPYMDEALHFHRLALMHGARVIAKGTADELTNRFTHRLFDVAGPEIRAARRRLNDASLEGVGTHRFGDRIHVTYDADDQEQAIRRVLEGLDVRIGPTRPTIEDTFVSLVTTSGGGAM